MRPPWPRVGSKRNVKRPRASGKGTEARDAGVREAEAVLATGAGRGGKGLLRERSPPDTCIPGCWPPEMGGDAFLL